MYCSAHSLDLIAIIFRHLSDRKLKAAQKLSETVQQTVVDVCAHGGSPMNSAEEDEQWTEVTTRKQGTISIPLDLYDFLF